MKDTLIEFFQPTNSVGYKSPIGSFYYPMSGVDLTVLDYFNNFIFCDGNYNRWLDFNFFDNYLGLNGFEIEKIEFLSDENYQWLHNKYNEIDKLTIFQDYLNEIPNDFFIKKYIEYSQIYHNVNSLSSSY